MARKQTVRGQEKAAPKRVPGGKPGDVRLASRSIALEDMAELPLRSPAFESGGAIPKRYASADGAENISPPLAWDAAPEGVKSYVLIVEDPDAPTPEPWVHWLAILPGDWTELPENAQVRMGRNTPGNAEYMGAAPPRGHPHRYFFQLFALNSEIDPGESFDRKALLKSMAGHIVGYGELFGTYQRQK